jgi:hypothetical protein
MYQRIVNKRVYEKYFPRFVRVIIHWFSGNTGSITNNDPLNLLSVKWALFFWMGL